jgi:ADP-heptose:LPS heptosyltransferase
VNAIKSNFLKIISRNKSRPLNLNNSQNFLILMNQKIGDMIVCSPILREIKLAYPKSKLHVLASEVNKDIVQANPYVDEVHVYKNQWPKLLPLLLKLRKFKFDVAVELEYKVVSRIIISLKIINPNCTIATSKREGRYGMGPQDVEPYDFYTKPSLTHQRDTAFDVLRLLNIKGKNKSYDVFYRPKNKLDALSFLSRYESEKITIGLNVEGSNEERRISDRDVRNIILGLYSMTNNIAIILFHKPNDSEYVAQLIPIEASKYTFLSYPTLSVLDLAALVDNLDVIISPDTSIVHMACAFNKPLVAIYRNNATNFDIWHPISDLNYVVFSQRSDSLKDIDVDEIINKSSKLIKSIESNQ